MDSSSLESLCLKKPQPSVPKRVCRSLRANGGIEGLLSNCPDALLSVSRSGFCAWKQQQPSRRSQEHHMMAIQIEQVLRLCWKTYGSPRIHAELLARGFEVGRNRVALLMQQLGLCARAKRRFRATTDSDHDWPVAVNLKRASVSCSRTKPSLVC